MAFREVGGNATDIKQTPDQPYEGIYIGHEEFDGQFGIQTIWKFRGKTEGFGIYGFTSLNRSMERINEGTLCRITFTGKKKMKTKYGIKDVNTCRVEVDDSASADPNDLPENYPAKDFDPDEAFATAAKRQGIPV